MRLFLAIPFPASLLPLIQGLQHDNSQNGIRWIPDANLHITLAFIGEADEQQLNIIIDKVEKVIANSQSFSLIPQSFFLKKSNAGFMIWLTFASCFLYRNLAIQIRKALKIKENREPLPHVTLARIKGKLAIDRSLIRLQELPDKRGFQVFHVELWHSITGPTGSVYRCIKKFSLKMKPDLP
ncbi:MAG: RNA 2',3'-cyclic phosphodiesterase [Cytophagaceae bacterium]